MSAALPKEREGAIRFEYSRWRLLLGLVTCGVAGVFLIAVGLGWRSTGSILSSVAICAVASWSILYVVRRVANPVEFLLRDGKVRAVYWNGKAREWPLQILSVEPSSLSSRWESSVLISDGSSGRAAFRLFSDLPRLDEFQAAIREDRAAV